MAPGTWRSIYEASHTAVHLTQGDSACNRTVSGLSPARRHFGQSGLCVEYACARLYTCAHVRMSVNVCMYVRACVCM
jgi:hypothetical protein